MSQSGVPVVRTATPDPDDEPSPPTDAAQQTPATEEVSPKADDKVSKPSENGEKTTDKSMEPPATAGANEKETPSKKRARDEIDDGAEEQSAAKKLDVKAGES